MSEEMEIPGPVTATQGNTNSPAPVTAPAPAPVPAPTPTPVPVPTPAPAVSTTATGADPKTKELAPVASGDDAWRAKMSGDDKKESARLERFGSPADVWKAYRNLESKVSSGELKSVTALPANATPEQVSEYRKANGIPDAPDKYDTTMPNGLVIGENDKPYVDNYLKYAHDKNMTTEQVKSNLEFYFKLQQDEMAQRKEQDGTYQIESVEKMKDEWGQEYKPNLNRIRGLLNMFSETEVDRLLTARTSDGRITGDDPAVLSMLNRLAREVDPAASVVPNSSNAPQAIADELQTLARQMGDSNSDYWSKDKGPALQARYRELLEAENKMKKRTA